MTMLRIVVVDYKMSNIFSIVNVFKHIGVDVVVSQSADDIKNADALVLPGVGAFAEAMKNLNMLQLVEPIKNFIKSGKPFLGICLGLQLLFTESDEFGVHKGLNLISGNVLKFPKQLDGNYLRMPIVGWNRVYRHDSNCALSPLNGIKDKEFMYFVHSFYVNPVDKKYISSYTNYNGFSYCSSICYENIFATQFHPEKSGEQGINLLKSWLLTFIKKEV
jgi:glutamine amidotransferase